jgi:hypothetical protein
MNDIERKNRRAQRFIIIKQIESIESNNCAVCPNRKSQDFECCKVCPIPSQLNELGKQLIAIRPRDVIPEKVVEVKKRVHSYAYERRKKREKERKKLGIPTKKIPKVKPPSYVSRRKKGDPLIVFSSDDYIQAVANGEYKAEIARRIGMADSTLHNRTTKWGLAGLTTDRARELLRKKDDAS